MPDETLPCLSCARELARHEAQIVALDRRLSDAVIAIHRDVDMAARALENKLESMNEFRAQIQQERGDYVQRAAWDQHITQDNEVHARMRDFIANFQGRVWGIGASIGIAGTILAVLINKLWN